MENGEVVNRGKTITFGIIIGNRMTFPNKLAEEGGREFIKRVKEQGFDIVVLPSEKSDYCTIQTREDSEKCASLFKKRAKDINGVLITLPNFGEEKSIAESLRLSGLDVPVMVHAFPDERGKMDIENRRDAFCGKISVCNNLSQYGIPFTATKYHIEALDSEEFKEDLDSFSRICRVVGGLRNCRIGTIGTRPSLFNTVRYSEKILEREGISVEPIDLLEILEQAKDMDKEKYCVQEESRRIKKYVATDDVPEESIEKMARLSLVISRWVKENKLDAIAVKCWPTIEKFYGVVPCTVMSMMSKNFLPSACETDVMGSISMYSLQLASGRPAALVDINNNYEDDPNKFIAFHCGNLPKSFFKDNGMKMSYHGMMAKRFGIKNTYGTCTGRIPSSPATFLRLSTNDRQGVRGYIAEGQFTDDELETFGSYGVVKIKGLQSLLKYITEEGFEHHVAVVQDHVGDILEEAMRKYLNWEIYRHKPS